jgi:hypothetical protein
VRGYEHPCSEQGAEKFFALIRVECGQFPLSPIDPHPLEQGEHFFVERCEGARLGHKAIGAFIEGEE